MTHNEVFVPVPNNYLITAKLIFLLSKKVEGPSRPPPPPPPPVSPGLTTLVTPPPPLWNTE